MNYLDIALKAWRDGEPLRRRRQRYKDYTYGRQWGDTVDVEGVKMTEEKLAAQSGYKPLTNNLIRQLMKCVVGNFRASLAEGDLAAEESPVSEEVASRNSLREMDCRMLEEFLISGCAIQRVVTEKRMAGEGVWVDNVSPGSFFINSFTDPRGLDIELVGMLHSMSLREVLMRFAPEGGAHAARLTEIYTARADRIHSDVSLGDAVAAKFFEAPAGRCRVIEVWTLESRAILRCNDTASGEYFVAPAEAASEIRAENSRRKKIKKASVSFTESTSLRWHCRFLSPGGDLLTEYDSPYAHGMHPFAVKFYPLIDGEVHSLVEDIIDQQRYVNRLITLIDHIMSVSAKGALLVPAGCLTHNMSDSEIGRLWAKTNSVIPYNPAKGEPKQIVSGADQSGAYQLLNTQLQLFQQISGVSGALQGHITNAHTSAALYDSQVQHSAVAILDLLQSFQAFRAARNRMIACCN